MFRSLRNAFISGLLLLAPIGVTVFVIRSLVELVGAPTSSLFFPFIDPENDSVLTRTLLNLLATLYILIAITVLGYFSRVFIGRFFVQLAENLISRIPFASTIYNTVKQIVDTFSAQKRAVFQKVVLIEWPQKDNFVIGFLTGEGKGEVQLRTAQELLNIFVPTTPNPTSGYLILVPVAKVRILDMTIAEGMKLIISGGAVVPPYTPREGSASAQPEIAVSPPQPVTNPGVSQP